MAFIEYNGKQYEYNDDLSWEKWRTILIGQHHMMEIIDWYYNNVLIDHPNDWGEVLGLCNKLMNKIGSTDQNIKTIMRNAGKAARGISVSNYSDKLIECNLLLNTGMSYNEIKQLSFQDVLFFNMLISEKNRVKE